MTTFVTLGKIRAVGLHDAAWAMLLERTGQTKPVVDLDLALSIGDVAYAAGVDAALWATQFIDDRRAVVRAIMPSVKRAAAHTKDKRVHDCIATLDAWLGGDDSVDLAAAVEEAWAAVEATLAAQATQAARAAARAAAWAAAAVEATLAAAAAAVWTAATRTSRAAAWAAYAAEEKEAEAAEAVEHSEQVADLIGVFPLEFFK